KNELVQLFVALGDLPVSILNDLVKWAPQAIDTASKLATFGYAHCVPNHTVAVYGSTLVLPTALEDALQYLGGMNDRIARQTERARVARYNMLRLSECIGESFTKGEAPIFDSTNPTVNTDPCADIVRQGWSDENPQGLGLYRGGIKQVKIFGFELISKTDS